MVDFAQVQLRPATEIYPKSVFIRFCEKNLRDIIWTNRMESKKKGLIIEEWLTETRANIFRKLKELKSNKMVKDCFTEDGDVYATVLNKNGKKKFLFLKKNNKKRARSIQKSLQKCPNNFALKTGIE